MLSGLVVAVMSGFGVLIRKVLRQGDDLAALRLHMSENYVRKPDFENVVDDLKIEIRAGNEKIMQLLLNQAKRR
jgi:hypothetical protein